MFYIIIFKLCFMQILYAYEMRCPERLELLLYSKYCNSSHPYHCLLKSDENVYVQECRPWEWTPKGFYPVLRGRNFDHETCPTTMYQPFVYLSHESYRCQYARSLCSELGQLSADNGTSTTDRSCSCDYSKGYEFIVIPKSICSCVPTEEDCSCYIRKSAIKDYFQDKNCDEYSGKVAIFTNNITYDGIDTKILNESTAEENLNGRIFLLAVIGLTISICLIFIITVTCPLLDEDREHRYKENVPIPKDILSKEVCYSYEIPVVDHTKTENNPQHDTETETQTPIVKSTDILIISTGTDLGLVTEFRDHLDQLKEDFGYHDFRIHLLEELFPQTKTVLTMDTVRRKCPFIFVFFSGEYVPETITKYGIKDRDFRLFLHNATSSSQTKIVCSCKEQLVLEKQNIYLNYLNFRENREKGKYLSKLRQFFKLIETKHKEIKPP